jgi:neutral trehalase
MVDGEFVPNVANGSGRRSWDRSQPCVGGLAVLALHELAPDRAFLEKVWPALLAWNRWWHRRRRNAAGLLSWGSEPFAPRIGDRAEQLQPATARGAALESGLDNTPMYDGVPFDPATHLMALSDVGLASLYIVDCEALATLAREHGRAGEAAELAARAEQYRRGLASLWNPDTGIFQNRRTDTGGFNPRLAPTCFYPLLAGATTPAQADAMIARHLLNPDEFWGEWVLPSVPRTDPAFPEQHYLRGRIWAPLNFLVYLGLRRAGRTAPAAELARRSLALFAGNWRERQGVFENYSALTGRGADEAFCDPLYAWSGLLALMAALQRGDVPLPSILRARQ